MDSLAYLPGFIAYVASAVFDTSVGRAFLGLGLVGFVVLSVRQLMS